jgi:two-component system, NarL family, sensor kinase
MPGATRRPEVVSEMIELVEESALYGCEHGSLETFSEISNRSGRFVDLKGHYVCAYDYNGTLLAHPYLTDKIGSTLIDHRDPFGMETIRALTKTARSGGGYVVFIWPNPNNGNKEDRSYANAESNRKINIYK